MRLAAIALAAAAFVAISLLVARWLNVEGVERSAIVELLRAQARGDATAMLAGLECPEPACVRVARANAARLRAPGALEIVRLDSRTAHSLGEQAGPTRVVWRVPGRAPVVQCAGVRREGNPLAGVTVTLLTLSAPIGGETGCP